MRNKIVIAIIGLLFSAFLASGQEQTNEQARLVVQTGHTQAVDSAAFSPDGRIVASGSWDNTIKLWEVSTGGELRMLAGHTSPVESVVFSPDGRTLASGSWDHTIKLWDVNSGQELRTLAGHTDSVLSVAFSPDGRTLASGSDDKTVKFWEVKSGKALRTLAGHTDSILSVAFSPDGQILASGSNDKTIKLWDASTGQELRTLAGHRGWVRSVAFSPDGRTLASGSLDDMIKLWDVSTGQELRTLAGHASVVESVTFSPDGRTLASASWDKTIKLWEVASGHDLRTLKGHTESVTSVVFSPDGRTLASASDDKTIKLWEFSTGHDLRTLAGHTDVIESVAFSPDGRTLASGSDDKTIKLWEFSTGHDLHTLTGHTGGFRSVSVTDGVRSVAFSPDGRTLASGSGDKTIKLWEVASGLVMRTLTGHTDGILSVAFSPDGRTLVSGSWDTIKLWKVSTGQEVRTLADHRGWVYSVAFSSDGRTLANGSDDHTIKLLDVGSGQEVRTLAGHTSSVESVAFSPDGRILASGSGSDDNTIKLWNVGSGQEMHTLTGHKSAILSVAFNPDGRTLASGSDDNTIKLWDAGTGQELRTLAGHASSVNSVAFSPDGQTLASGSEDGTIKLWDEQSGKLLASLIALDEKDWAVVTPSGLFDASPGGRKLMHYVVGNEVVTLDQMTEAYYVPGLLQKVMQRAPLPNVELFSGKDLYPKVDYQPIKPDQKKVTVKLTNRGGGIGQVQVLYNGVGIVRDARPKGFDPRSPGATFTIDLSQAPVKAGEENRIEIVARNAAGSLSTRGTEEAEMVYKDDAKAALDPPNIYAIVGGISNYTDDQLKLGFAAKDAEDFAHAFDLGAVKLLNGDPSKVHIRLLTSDADTSGIKFAAADAKVLSATKANFTQAFADFRRATPKDVFIVYLAGHGIALNLNQDQTQPAGDTYLYLTQEATTGDKTVLALESVRRAMTISSEELIDLMNQNQALKRVLILDTCAAGALSNSLVAKRDLPSDQIVALERLKNSTGYFVLMGAAADAVSYEANQYGQGLLTYSLLQGMKGAGLRDDQFADVAALFGYAQETVPQMAKNIGGIQRPMIITPDNSNSFDIGKFTAAEQKLIVLPNPKPLILRPTLLNEKLKRDDLNLTQLLRQDLRELSYSGTARGTSAPLVFVEADEMTDAIIPSGLYRVDGDTLTLSVVLYRNEQQIGNEMRISGKVSEKEMLVKQLIGELVKASQ